ncbi:MAG: DUF5610 domain-containing protein [Mariprofundus sp.]
MTLPISGLNTVNTMLFSQKPEPERTADAPAGLLQTNTENRINIGAKNNPTELILKSAMEKINEVFKPYLGDGAINNAVESGQDMSPKATADSIISFATQLIGKTETLQADLPTAEQSSRQQLFKNVQTGIERGFTQARDILESMQALQGGTKETVDATHARVQEGLSNLALMLGMQPADKNAQYES